MHRGIHLRLVPQIRHQTPRKVINKGISPSSQRTCSRLFHFLQFFLTGCVTFFQLYQVFFCHQSSKSFFEPNRIESVSILLCPFVDSCFEG
ncbi:hypothetical protein BT96DRAFT_649342 [Gymnopus androsaceus JB14]|uniref:Uncharacterized protein n=1 Tax=Gymnopus androsaceus JB14 TaxID=1447944 RepID=A0A6A4HRH6_9AGAR|nr:hypothetical protein BT96DRAFT_649342 [Gymnopus androsaceus JB14]